MSIIFEPVDVINKRLKDHFGETEGTSNYRIVWSEDQFEMRQTNYSDEGFQLLIPEVRLLPKYRQWIQEKWVLERVTEIPYVNEKELPASRLSYEPVFVFESAEGTPLKPAWAVAKLAIDSINQAMQKAGLYTTYHDKYDGLTKEQYFLKRQEEIDDIVKAMTPDESAVGDALATKNAISMAGLDGTKK